MTDEQWSDLTHRLQLPDAARSPIENELDLYRRLAESTTSRPSETRENFERAANVANKLLSLFEGFGADELYAFAELGDGGTPRLDALKL